MFKSWIKYYLFYISILKVEQETVLFELFLEDILSGEGAGRKPNKDGEHLNRDTEWARESFWLVPTVFWFLASTLWDERLQKIYWCLLWRNTFLRKWNAQIQAERKKGIHAMIATNPSANLKRNFGVRLALHICPKPRQNTTVQIRKLCGTNSSIESVPLWENGSCSLNPISVTPWLKSFPMNKGLPHRLGSPHLFKRRCLEKKAAVSCYFTIWQQLADVCTSF